MALTREWVEEILGNAVSGRDLQLPHEYCAELCRHWLATHPKTEMEQCPICGGHAAPENFCPATNPEDSQP